MKSSLTADDLADELLRKNGQNVEYPYLTEERLKRIKAHELSVTDIDLAVKVPISRTLGQDNDPETVRSIKETHYDRLSARERRYSRERRAANALQRAV